MKYFKLFFLIVYIFITSVFVNANTCAFSTTYNGTCIAKDECLSDIWAFGSIDKPICENNGISWSNPKVSVCCILSNTKSFRVN